MDPLSALGLVSNVVQLVDFSFQMISKSAEGYNSGRSPLIGAPAIEAAAADMKLLKVKLQEDTKFAHDEGMRLLCQSCEDVADRLLLALKNISVNGKQQVWSSIRKALKTIMTKTQIEHLDRTLSSIRQELNLRIAVDLRDQICNFNSEHSDQIAKLDSMSRRILEAMVKQQDVFKVEMSMQRALIDVVQRQEQHASTAIQEQQLAKLPNVPQAAFNSLERQHDPLCLANTRVDLLKTIYEWIDSPGAQHIFWLSGLAGTGKSTIAGTVAQKHGHFTVSFFFSRGGGDTGRARKLFTSIAVQLADRSPILRRYICNAIEECSNISSLSLHDQWRYLILTPLSRLEESFRGLSLLLVIDALDECDDEKDIKAIIQLAAEARSIKTLQFRVFMASRPDIPIRHGFYHIDNENHKDFLLHDIPKTTIGHDITHFLEHNFDIISRERALPCTWPGKEIIQDLVQMSGGLFIWAATACRFVREGKRYARRRLETIMQGGYSGSGPLQTLDNIYLTVLENSVRAEFDETEREDMFKTLELILGSLVILNSPLTAKSLATLVQLEEDDIEQSLEDLHAILNIPAEKGAEIPIFG